MDEWMDVMGECIFGELDSVGWSVGWLVGQMDGGWM